jgi:hypothetical protein
MEVDFASPEYQDYIRRANHARGHVINYTILLERVLDDFIATAFSENQDKKIDLIQTLISEGLTYRSKVKVVLSLIKKHYPNDLERKSKFGSIKNDLSAIADERNKFAHEILYIQLTKENFSKFEICLVSFKEIDKVVAYTIEDIIGIVERVQKYIDIVGDIRRDIWGQ